MCVKKIIQFLQVYKTDLYDNRTTIRAIGGEGVDRIYEVVVTFTSNIITVEKDASNSL